MAKVYKRTLAVGGRVWWPAGMTCERAVEVQVKKAKNMEKRVNMEERVQVKRVQVKKEKKEKKEMKEKKAKKEMKEKRQVAVPEPERPTITTKSGRNCNPA